MAYNSKRRARRAKLYKKLHNIKQNNTTFQKKWKIVSIWEQGVRGLTKTRIT